MSFNSPSYSQFEESVKESHGRREFLFSFVYLFLVLNLLPFLKLELLGQATRENVSNASWLYVVYKRWPPTCRMEHLPFLSHFSGLSLKDSRIRSLVLTPHLFDTLTLRQRRRAPRHDTPQSHSHQACRDAHATFFRARGKTHATTIKFQGLHQRFVLFSTFPLSFFYPLSSRFLFRCSVADDQWPSPVLNFRSSTAVLLSVYTSLTQHHLRSRRHSTWNKETHYQYQIHMTAGLYVSAHFSSIRMVK